ncbi:MAG: biotin synthase, partial [Clostridiales bacterium]|nr:biotin synthase [Clostridiales bacterium]
QGLRHNATELALYRNAPRFSAAGQATQMIIGASPESDRQILQLTEGLYQKYKLKRVFFSAYIPVVEDSLLPALTAPPPLLREHRLYQADFLLRQYHFSADELLAEEAPNFNPYLDPKCNWALQNLHRFPVDVNRAPLEVLLRVPGIGPTSARRILRARREARLSTAELKRMGVVLKRARYFILATDLPYGLRLGREGAVRALMDPGVSAFGMEQLSLFGRPELAAAKTLFEATEEAVRCLASRI